MDAKTVKDKIKKAIALGSSANENESTAALDKAEELFKKYSKDLNTYDRERLADEIHRKRERIKYNRTLESFLPSLKLPRMKKRLTFAKRHKMIFLK